MATKHTPAPPTPPPDPLAPSETLAAFSLSLAQRLPERLIRRFVMPPRIMECAEVFILEVSSDEEITAAIYTDAVLSDVERRSAKLTLEAERRELIKLAIVGIGVRRGSEIMYRHVNHDGVPFNDPKRWSLKAWTLLHRYFGEVNGVPTEEIASGIEGAQTVGAFAPPTSATPASADTGR